MMTQTEVVHECAHDHDTQAGARRLSGVEHLVVMFVLQAAVRV